MFGCQIELNGLLLALMTTKNLGHQALISRAPYQHQSGLIRQSSIPIPTRSPRQSFHTNANQILLDKPFTSISTRPYQVELLTELDKIVDNKYNGNFHPEENFHQFVTINNQEIFNVKGDIEWRFSADYTEGIFVNLAFW